MAKLFLTGSLNVTRSQFQWDLRGGIDLNSPKLKHKLSDTPDLYKGLNELDRRIKEALSKSTSQVPTHGPKCHRKHCSHCHSDQAIHQTSPSPPVHLFSNQRQEFLDVRHALAE